MGSASRKKKERRTEERPSAAPEAVADYQALDELVPDPYVPPKPVTLALLAATLLGALYFVMQGVEAARLGEGRVAELLLRVEPRDELPKGFELPSMEGEAVALESFRGKVVFLNFWATWCPPCVEEMPSMRRLGAKLAGDDRFVMLAVSTDDEWAPVRTFFGDEEPPFPVLLDSGGDVARSYGTEKFPETYVMVDGKLVGFIMGPRDWDTWYAESYLRSLIERGRAG